MAIPCGRFAPSPTGELHFGSLIAALASFLNSRSKGGRWLLRIDDLDQPRVVHSTIASIQRCLEAHGLTWDGQVIYQNERLTLYQEALNDLKPYTFACQCSRKRIAETAEAGPMGFIYPGTCRNLHIDPEHNPSAIRVQAAGQIIEFQDQIQGLISADMDQQIGDFIIRRADGIFAYHLASAVDDCLDGITEVIRGMDLLPSTACQIHLQKLLQKKPPRYGHFPIAVNSAQQKLSKLTGAPPVRSDEAVPTLYRALEFLGQHPPRDLQQQQVNEIVEWGIQHWTVVTIPAQEKITLK